MTAQNKGKSNIFFNQDNIFRDDSLRRLNLFEPKFEPEPLPEIYGILQSVPETIFVDHIIKRYITAGSSSWDAPVNGVRGNNDSRCKFIKTRH